MKCLGHRDAVHCLSACSPNGSLYPGFAVEEAMEALRDLAHFCNMAQYDKAHYSPPPSSGLKDSVPGICRPRQAISRFASLEDAVGRL